MTKPEGNVFELSELPTVEDGSADPFYREFLRSGLFSAGLYRLASGSPDPQAPHAEDELYHVLSGRAVLEIDGRRHPVGPGSIAFVPREVEHRFVEIAEDLEALVLFAPPESAT